jgi:hypothetical protein
VSGGGRALEAFSKTRILLVGFGYHETNFRKLTCLHRRKSGSILCNLNYFKSVAHRCVFSMPNGVDAE